MTEMDHGNLRDLSGQTFGSLTVSHRLRAPGLRVSWVCLCACGRYKAIQGHNLTRGLSRSCGRCVGAKEHLSEYRTWADMHSRCANTKHKAYRLYGARGIRVCEEWRSFPTFLADMGTRPDGMSLDRIDNHGPYSPVNCRWATAVQQLNNRRDNRHLTHQGRTQTMAMWARELGLNYRTVKTRLNVLGWTVEEALTR